MKNISKNYKKLLVATLFACFACNGLQAMEQTIGTTSTIQQHAESKSKKQPTQDNHENKTIKEGSFPILSLPQDMLEIVILEALKNGTHPNKIALICKKLKNSTKNVIIKILCGQAKVKIKNNDPNFDQWFNQFHKDIQSLIKKRLDQIAKEYVNGYIIKEEGSYVSVPPKTEEELNNLPNTIFKRIFINKWFWLKNNQQFFLDNTLPAEFDIQKFNQKINNIENGNLNLFNMNITDEILELILEIIIKNGLVNKITHLNLNNNQLTNLPVSFGKLTQLERLYIGLSKLTTLPESFGNLTQITLLNLYSNELTTLPESFENLNNLIELNLDYNQLTAETKDWLKGRFGNITSHCGQPVLQHL